MGWEGPAFLLRQSSLTGQDYYRTLGVDYEATDEEIRTTYLRLALRWHPDKHKGDAQATLRFQEISEAYRVLSDPAKREAYDVRGDYDVGLYSIGEYLDRFKCLILTCSGLGIRNQADCSRECRLLESAVSLQ
eukprot:SM000131S26688  [mRNA]  locus=s131:55497:56985:+ [translate_table: standard]